METCVTTSFLFVFNRERSEEDSYCDVTITVDGQQFHGHRCILSKFSKVLHKMFKVEVIEFLIRPFDVKIYRRVDSTDSGYVATGENYRRREVEFWRGRDAITRCAVKA